MNFPTFASIKSKIAKLVNFYICIMFVTIFALSALAGCASNPPVVQPVDVRVPVAVPCKTPIPTRPAFAVDALPLGADIWDQMTALRADRIQRQGYETELEAAVKACQ